ncbi:MAG: hypothetical protein JWO81_2700 [Alphaproteobacteria bacterium]|nr:hypothetical protein [Alphaproteobacteria bacterium]
MNDDKRNDFLAQEYLQLQKTIEDFDGRALTIKAWSITFSATGVGLAYDKAKPEILLVASLSALVFWLVDAVWKIHQHSFNARIEAIEAHFRGGGGADTAPFQIRQGWYDSFHGPRLGKRWMKVPFYMGVMLPHAVIAVAGLLLCLWAPPR